MIGERIDRLRQFLREHVADGVIIMQPENLRYFSGFTGGEGALVVTGATAVLWTDSRYTEQAAGQSGTWYTIGNHQGRLAECIARSLREGGAQAVVYESNFLTHMMFEQIADQTECGFEGYNLNVLRAVKEPFELTATRKANLPIARQSRLPTTWRDNLPMMRQANRNLTRTISWRATKFRKPTRRFLYPTSAS